MKTDEEIGVEAARLAHNKILQEAKSVRLSTKKVLRRIAQGLDSYETKCKFDGGQYGSQKWVYSKKLVNWETRSKSIDQAIAVLDMMPKETDFDDLNPATPVQVIIQVVDASKSAGEQTPGAVSSASE